MSDEYKDISRGMADYKNTISDKDLYAQKDFSAESNLSLESDDITNATEIGSVLSKEADETDNNSLESDNIFDGTSGKSDNAIETDEPVNALESDSILADNKDSQDYFSDRERATQVLSDFKSDKWEQLSLDDKKQAISQLADYNADILGIENKPGIDYYNNEDEGDFGGYSEADNTIYINEYNMDDAIETADTISHEYRHSYQHERAMNPTTELDHLFKENFDDYIPASQDFATYQEQIVESDAREYAQNFKDFINRI